MPSRIMLQRKLAAQTTQPHPPSGGAGAKMSSSSMISSSSSTENIKIYMYLEFQDKFALLFCVLAIILQVKIVKLFLEFFFIQI